MSRSAFCPLVQSRRQPRDLHREPGQALSQLIVDFAGESRRLALADLAEPRGQHAQVLVRLAGLAFGLLAGTDVADEALPVRLAIDRHDLRADLDREGRAVLALVDGFEQRPSRLRRCIPLRRHAVAVRRRPQVADIEVPEFLARVAIGSDRGVVAVDDVAIGGNQQEDVARELHELVGRMHFGV